MLSQPPGAPSPLTLQRWYARDAQSAAGRHLGAVARLRWDALAGMAAPSGAAHAPGGAAAPGLRLWSAECADHYLLVLELRGPGGALLEAEACQARAQGEPPAECCVARLRLPRGWVYCGCLCAATPAAHSSHDAARTHAPSPRAPPTLHSLPPCPPAPQVGFRSACVRGGALLHNNARVTLRGVNRHEWHGVRGKVRSLGACHPSIRSALPASDREPRPRSSCPAIVSGRARPHGPLPLPPGGAPHPLDKPPTPPTPPHPLPSTWLSPEPCPFSLRCWTRPTWCATSSS